MNYGFYDPPCNGKSGKFLDEERPLIEYPLKGSPPVLEVGHSINVIAHNYCNGNNLVAMWRLGV